MTSPLTDKLLARIGKTRADLPSPEQRLFSREGVQSTSELRRVLALPRRDLATGLGGRFGTPEELAELLTDVYKRPGGKMKLRPIQALALAEAHDVGGLLGPIRVGAGKTLVTFLAPKVLEAKRPLLTIPAKLKHKTDREWWALQEHWVLPLIRTESYELLGRAQHAEFLESYQPDLIIMDECHKLKATKSAVTRRVGRYMTKHPETRVIALSGTITAKSLRDYWHILRWALGAENMPLPNEWREMMQWADCLDVKGGSSGGLTDPGALTQLFNDEEKKLARTDDVRKIARIAFRRRLTETPGVVATGDVQVACSLSIIGHELDLRDRLEHFKTLRTEWETPDGHPFTEPVDLWRHARELSCDFYYVWFNEERFKECLVKQLKNEGSTIGSIEKRILNALVHMTVKGIDWVKVTNIRVSGDHTNERMTSVRGTDSLSKSTTSYSKSSTEPVTSAGKGRSPERVGGEGISQLITTIEQVAYGACSVLSATELSECLTTLLKVFPGLSPILLDAVKAARAPKEWLIARRRWCKFVRDHLKKSKTLDSELQVIRAVQKGEISAVVTDELTPGSLTLLKPVDAWEEWVKVKDTFEPNTVPRWIGDTTTRYAMEWGQKNVGIIWVEHIAFGERLAEMSGMPYYNRKGQDSKGNPIEAEKGDRSVIASILANAEGRNLQCFSKNLITSCPPRGDRMEQLLGRTHRDGQQADEVEVEILLSCIEQWSGFQRAIEDSRYIEQTLGSSQKLLYADVDVPTEQEVALKQNPLWSKGSVKSAPRRFRDDDESDW